MQQLVIRGTRFGIIRLILAVAILLDDLNPVRDGVCLNGRTLGCDG